MIGMTIWQLAIVLQARIVMGVERLKPLKQAAIGIDQAGYPGGAAAAFSDQPDGIIKPAQPQIDPPVQLASKRPCLALECLYQPRRQGAFICLQTAAP